MILKYFTKCYISFFSKNITVNFATNPATNTSGKNLKSIRKKKISETNNVPDYIKKFFASDKERKIIEKFPYKLLKKKPSPKRLYLAHPEAQKIISEHIKKSLCKDDTILEVNPGPGVLTGELIKNDYLKMILIESMDEFVKHLELEYKNESSRIKIKNGDFINLWKLVFRDRIDQGSRLNELFSDVPKKEFNDDPNMKIFACVGSLNFFKHLINSLVFGNSLYSYGRCEMFLVVPPPIYIHLTCSNEIGYLLYRSTSILFQIMFEYQFITKIPREYFLPWSYESNSLNSKRLNKLSEIKCIDSNFLYFIRIIPRKSLYELCPSEDMQALWYFVKQSCVSRKTRIIPSLEKWIPNCGPRLIINKNKGDNIKQLFPEDNNKTLPKYSKPCLSITKNDYYSLLDIFSEFGDLTPSQMLTIFCLFRSWPEYKESSFLASLENSLLKLETSNTENIDEIEINEDEIEVHDEEIRDEKQ